MFFKKSYSNESTTGLSIIDGVLGLCYLPLIQKGSSYKFSMEIKYASMSERKKTHLGEFLTLNT